MVWFQCEDCGENLKKPKLTAHFWKCSAFKLSCIDCGQMFGQDTVQGHNQCISEAEKYGPKGLTKPSNPAATSAKNSNQKPDVDINVGLSDRPPWCCSLCKTNATSRQALLLHADGKKHRGKARGFHAANKAANQAAVPVPHGNNLVQNNTEETVVNDVNQKQTQCPTEETVVNEKKRKSEEAYNIISKEKKSPDTCGKTSNGEVIQAPTSKRDKNESNNAKSVKWKKIITATLKTGPTEGLKMRKLKKLVVKALKEAGATENDDELSSIFEHKSIQVRNLKYLASMSDLHPKAECFLKLDGSTEIVLSSSATWNIHEV